MNLKRLAGLTLLLLYLAGCSDNKTLTKNSDLKSDSDMIRPHPVSTVFHRPQGTMVLIFTNDGKFQEIISKGSAPIAGNNSFSIEQAAQVAKLRAERNIAEFIGTQLSTQRTVKVLSTVVQKSLENTSNGVIDDSKFDDKDFDDNGDPISSKSRSKVSESSNLNNPNTNSEKIVQLVKESITSNSNALLKGVVISDEKIDQSGRTIEVEVRTGIRNISGAKELRKVMESN